MHLFGRVAVENITARRGGTENTEYRIQRVDGSSLAVHTRQPKAGLPEVIASGFVPEGQDDSSPARSAWKTLREGLVRAGRLRVQLPPDRDASVTTSLIRVRAFSARGTLEIHSLCSEIERLALRMTKSCSLYLLHQTHT
jgi:hypothetical protein